jgi:hypothetical protein
MNIRQIDRYKPTKWHDEMAQRISLGFQCPECYGIRIELMPRQPHDPHRCQCQECGCQWLTSQ